MKSSHGAIQGYDGVAVVDAKHQLIVAAEAFGVAQKQGLLEPMVARTRENFQAIADENDIFDAPSSVWTAAFTARRTWRCWRKKGLTPMCSTTCYWRFRH